MTLEKVTDFFLFLIKFACMNLSIFDKSSSSSMDVRMGIYPYNTLLFYLRNVPNLKVI